MQYEHIEDKIAHGYTVHRITTPSNWQKIHCLPPHPVTILG